ncbi:MAG: 4-hydroxy-tetrahydrodipicolinate reductase [Chloroflexota bacterium]
MKIIIAGYGRMGHEIEKTAIQRGHSIAAIYDTQDDWKKKPVPEADVVIEFTAPDIAPELILSCLNMGIPVVSGTTGWNDKIDTIKEVALRNARTFFYASNYSIGVNIFYKINRQLATFLCNMQNYEVNIHEIHHIHKKDAPSGTAITLANQILENCRRFKSWSFENKKNNSIEISSARVGEVPGTHIINWESEIDSIEIKHTSHNRQGLALGALLAAEWIQGKTGVFGMEDLLSEVTTRNN